MERGRGGKARAPFEVPESAETLLLLLLLLRLLLEGGSFNEHIK